MNTERDYKWLRDQHGRVLSDQCSPRRTGAAVEAAAVLVACWAGAGAGAVSGRRRRRRWLRSLTSPPLRPLHLSRHQRRQRRRWRSWSGAASARRRRQPRSLHTDWSAAIHTEWPPGWVQPIRAVHEPGRYTGTKMSNGAQLVTSGGSYTDDKRTERSVSDKR